MTSAHSPTAAKADVAWMSGALSAVWSAQQHLVTERIERIESAIGALADDRLDKGLRYQAQGAAHMLAGSIGTFGFEKASRAAFSLELWLANPTRDDAPALSALTHVIRQEVEDDRGPLAQLRAGEEDRGAVTPQRGSAQ